MNNLSIKKISTLFIFFIVLLFSFCTSVKADSGKIITSVKKDYKLELVEVVPRTYTSTNTFGYEMQSFLYEYIGMAGYEAKNPTVFTLSDKQVVCNDPYSPGLLSAEQCKNFSESELGDDNFGTFWTYKSFVANGDKAFFETNLKSIDLTITSELQNYIFSGEECRKSSGCVAIKNTTTSKKLFELSEKYGRTEDKTIIRTFGYVDDASIIKEMMDASFKEDIDCSTQGTIENRSISSRVNYTAAKNNAFDYAYNVCNYYDNVYAGYFALTSDAENNHIETTVYNNINTLEAISGGDDKNYYVCVGLKFNKGAFDSYDGFRIIKGVGMNQVEAKQKCSKVFDTNYENHSYAENPNPIVSTFGVYKITEASTSTTELPVSNVSSGMKCSWDFKIDDKDSKVNMSFSFGAAYNSGKMSFSDMKNIGEFYPSVMFSPTDMQRLLNKDSSLLLDVQNSIYAEESFDWANFWGWVGIGVTVAGSILFAIPTLGSSLAIGGITAGAAIAGLAIKVAGTIVIGVVIKNSIRQVVNVVSSYTGNYAGKTWFVYGNNQDAKKYSGVTCKYTEFTDDFDIKSDVIVDCNTLLSGTFGKILTKIFNVLRFVACSALVVFSIFDFIKPIVSSDSEMLQKSGGKFVKRLILFILIMFVPAIVKLLLSLIDQSSCNI